MHAGTIGYRLCVALFASAILMVAAVVVMAPEARGQSAGKCFGRSVTIAGTAGPDIKIGTFGSDVIATYGGADTVRGEADFGGLPGGGTDYICLGDGPDVADGAAKADFINGGAGNDILDGDNFPSPFGDTLIGGVGNDTFTGGQGNDKIQGGPGNDRIDLGAATVNQGADRVSGGTGNDLINEATDGSTDRIDAGPGDDTCTVDQSDVVVNCESVIRIP